MSVIGQIRAKYQTARANLHERGRREWAAAEAMAMGRGGVTAVHKATGMARSTIHIGIRELKQRDSGQQPESRVRRPGAGRRPLTEKHANLPEKLEQLVEPVTRGDPESPLRWTSKSTYRLASELTAGGIKIGATSVGKLLRKLGYSLQANRKTLEGANHPDRDAQFHYINSKTAEHLKTGNPAVSVDTKKKELVGNYKNGGHEYRPKGKPRRVKGHDFAGELGRAAPYGVYDIALNVGWVSVGISADTGEFAVESIRRWWCKMGGQAYPDASGLLITADAGGSNGYRLRLWKLELQQFADELGVPITVCHLPPGTSKWNKIEHRLFSFIAMNWRGRPLVDYQTIVKLISATKTDQGLEVQCELDETVYPKGRKVSDAEMKTIRLQPHDFHGEWNYTIHPRAESPTAAGSVEHGDRAAQEAD
ncbi:MAG: ISAzo13 family transposase [bacterium]|nr:ISAzo13 family transposase [bacterium]